MLHFSFACTVQLFARHLPSVLSPAESAIPEYFLCPITAQLMRQPAMTPYGVTYDLDAISEWLTNKQIDPSTNQPLRVEQLCPNRTVRSMIEDYIAKGPDFLTHR